MAVAWCITATASLTIWRAAGLFLKATTCSCLNEFNTSYQLIAQQKEEPLNEEDTILYMPYLLAYMLTGKLAQDSSIASTSAVYTESGYDSKFLSKINLSSCNFAPTKPVGSLIGNLKDELKVAFNLDYDIKVLVTCSHDTASAIMTVMGEEEHPLYLSSGTWSLFGTIVDKPIINDVTFNEAYTN